MTSQLELINHDDLDSDAAGLIGPEAAGSTTNAWRLAPETIAIGLKGVAEARKVLREHQGGLAA